VGAFGVWIDRIAMGRKYAISRGYPDVDRRMDHAVFVAAVLRWVVPAD